MPLLVNGRSTFLHKSDSEWKSVDLKGLKQALPQGIEGLQKYQDFGAQGNLSQGVETIVSGRARLRGEGGRGGDWSLDNSKLIMGGT